MPVNYYDFLINKLCSFCNNFNIFYLRPKLQDIYESLEIESKKITAEHNQITKLMKDYEASFEYDG